MKLLQDIKTAVNVFGEVRKAREAGASAVQIKPVYTVPLITFAPAWVNTIEGSLTWKCGRETDRAVAAVFYALPYEVQRKMEFTPKEPVEWVERAKFWQRQLKPALPPETYHTVMVMFIRGYERCLRIEKEAAVCSVRMAYGATKARSTPPCMRRCWRCGPGEDQGYLPARGRAGGRRCSGGAPGPPAR